MDRRFDLAQAPGAPAEQFFPGRALPQGGPWRQFQRRKRFGRDGAPGNAPVVTFVALRALAGGDAVTLRGVAAGAFGVVCRLIGALLAQGWAVSTFAIAYAAGQWVSRGGPRRCAGSIALAVPRSGLARDVAAHRGARYSPNGSTGSSVASG